MTRPDSTYDPSDASVHNRLFFRLFQAGNTLDRQTSKSLGITTVQWSVLGALSRPQVREGMSFSELTEYLVVSRQSLDGVLKRLEREKHVQRVADTVDRRAKKVVLTPKGREFWNSLQPRIYEFYRQALASFGFDDKVALVHFLNQLNAGLASVHMDAAPGAHAPEEPARSA
ncbi:MarR family winged helix-turn-helix transcriptional regulator [Cupriavidus consociatus]|uniref:MarR family winged helix-turn-helix transcriptional regulator n=1 Tax=Cupriavidus consociatus TaxID=2821357 RepID=UPI001AE4ED7A|nr:MULTISPECIES: MarR family transcriptional regulator [unclassified Cupriavidus]MBP0623262.1 MarR family transcriptional regulator [Cupriavidus sp. LEh25]MDK2659955.1 MarR family transcriptional regulator [Cupriavidus sp. LEh21]